MSELAYMIGVKAGLEMAARFCERNEMGISTKAGGKYTPGHSVAFELGQGTHPGMGYASALRALAQKEGEVDG